MDQTLRSRLVGIVAAAAVLGGLPDAVSADAGLAALLDGVRHDRTPRAAPTGAVAATGACVVVPAGGTRILTADATCAQLASDATLDLGGRTLRGEVVAWGSGATLRNGTVVGALDFVDCRDCTIDDVHVRDGREFVVQAGPGLLVTGSRFTDNSVAIDVYYAREGGVRVVDSVFEDNFIGVNIAYPSGNTVESSAFRGNQVGVSLWDEDEEGVNDNTVVGNLFEGDRFGVLLRVSCDSEGIPCHQGNRVEDNRFREGEGSGLVVDATACEAPGTDCDDVAARIRGNRFERNGFSPDDAEPDRDDGLTVRGPPWVGDGIEVAENQAYDNAALGIDAPGVLDGGGNRAGGNGDPRQCVGVVCEWTVTIDIRPESVVNTIAPRPRGGVPVALLGAPGFDVLDVDVSTLAFGPAGAAPAHRQGGHVEHVDGDVVLDLVSHYRMRETGLRPGDDEACVTGRTLTGQPFRGCDAVVVQEGSPRGHAGRDAPRTRRGPRHRSRR